MYKLLSIFAILVFSLPAFSQEEEATPVRDERTIGIDKQTVESVPDGVVMEKPIDVRQLGDIYNRQSQELLEAEETIERLTKSLEIAELRLKKTEQKLTTVTNKMYILGENVDVVNKSLETLPADIKKQIESQVKDMKNSAEQVKGATEKPISDGEDDLTPVVNIASKQEEGISTQSLIGYCVGGIGFVLIVYFLFPKSKRSGSKAGGN